VCPEGNLSGYTYQQFEVILLTKRSFKKINNSRCKLTLYHPEPYQIKVPGTLDVLWVDDANSLYISVDKALLDSQLRS